MGCRNFLLYPLLAKVWFGVPLSTVFGKTSKLARRLWALLRKCASAAVAFLVPNEDAAPQAPVTALINECVIAAPSAAAQASVSLLVERWGAG